MTSIATLTYETITRGRQTLDLSDSRLPTIPAPLLHACVVASSPASSPDRASALRNLRSYASQDGNTGAELLEQLDAQAAFLQDFLAGFGPDPMNKSYAICSVLDEAAEVLSNAGDRATSDAITRIRDDFETICSTRNWAQAERAIKGAIRKLQRAGPRTVDQELAKKAKAFCRWLRKLDLQGNELEAIPAEMAVLRGLKELSLARNRFSDVPEWLFSLNLVSLDLSGNRLRAIPKTVEAAPQLQTLSLARNELSSVEEHIFANPSLTSLDLSFNQLTNLPALTTASTLTSLGLSENAIPCLPSLERFPLLETLDCSHNF